MEHNKNTAEETELIEEFNRFLEDKEYPCTGAKAALAKGQLEYYIAQHLGCPADDKGILQFMYNFVDTYRQTRDMYHTAIIIFKEPRQITESEFETLLWQRLQAISDLDAENYNYDPRVKSDPQVEHFSFSLKEEAFFINGMHPSSCRASRRFKYPCLVINPHQQFEELKQMKKYFPMRASIRKKDLKYCGSPNVMARDFYHYTEALQYSGKVYDKSWKCPLKINHKNKTG